MNAVFWPEFGVLFAAALVGGAALLPFARQLIESAAPAKPFKLSMPKLLLMSYVQTAVVSAVAIGIGLMAAHAIGLGAPFIVAAITGKAIAAPAPMLTAAVGLGFFGGVFLTVVDFTLLPWLPKTLLDLARRTSLAQNFSASLYGGINEELLMRLFGVSALAWLLSKVWHTAAGLPTNAAFYSAIVVMAVVFGLGHLPVTRKLVGRVTPLLLARALLLNGVIGVACGWLYWRYGIEAAILAHFTADVVYHVGGTIVLRLNDRYRFRRFA